MSAKHRYKFAALYRQRWRLHMSEKFSSGTINSKLTIISKRKKVIFLKYFTFAFRKKLALIILVQHLHSIITSVGCNSSLIICFCPGAVYKFIALCHNAMYGFVILKVDEGMSIQTRLSEIHSFFYTLLTTKAIGSLVSNDRADLFLCRSMVFCQMMYRFPILLDASAAALQRKGDKFLAKWADIMTGNCLLWCHNVLF